MREILAEVSKRKNGPNAHIRVSKQNWERFYSEMYAKHPYEVFHGAFGWVKVVTPFGNIILSDFHAKDDIIV